MCRRSFARCLRSLRQVQALDLEAAAQRARMAQSYLARLEAADEGCLPPSFEVSERLARAYRCSGASLRRLWKAPG